MASIELRHVSKRYSPSVHGVRDVSLQIEDGEFIIFLGPSGCGKSTTLRMIAGLESLSDGEILIGGKLVNAMPPRDRNVAVVFQSYALYPHMSVAQNMAFGLKMRGTPSAVIRSKVDQAATLLGLTPYLDRKPAALSGGQRQRVALGRAIVRDPVAFLLDEPLSNLDAQLRSEMRLELVKLHRRLGRTVVHVTHDQVEAMTMGDRICIMRGGSMIQVGRPLEVYANPADTFVARFLATPPMNLIPGILQGAADGGLAVEIAGDLSVSVAPSYRAAYAHHAGSPVILGLRPEDFYEAPRAPDWQPIPFTVVAVEALGAELVLVGQIETTSPAAAQDISVRLSRHFAAEPGQQVTLYLDPHPMHLFDADTTKLIPPPGSPGPDGEGCMSVALHSLSRRFWLHAGLVLMCAIIVLPPLWVLRTSFLPEPQAYSTSVLPGFTPDNYATLLTRNKFSLFYVNSLVVALGSVFVALPFAAMTGYAFARFRTGGRLARFLVLATQMLPPVALVLPAFAIFRAVGLTNSVPGLILVYSALNLPFLTWILMGFFEGVPIDLEWAAMTDGTTAWGAFWRIVVPVSLPGIAAAGVLGFILSWNEFLFALVLTGPSTQTIPVALASLQSSNGVQIAKVSAGVVLAILPLVIASRFIQRFIVQGLSFGSVK